jgi:hypothetical protein
MCGGRYDRQKEGPHACRLILFFEEAEIGEELRSGKDKIYPKPREVRIRNIERSLRDWNSIICFI